MSQFTIITKGIAASYLKSGNWKVLFPVNECHNLKLKLGGSATDTEGIVLGQMGVRIDISVTEPLTQTSKGDDYDDFLDLTGPGLHSALKTKFPLDEMNAVLVSIENGVFSAADHEAEAYTFVNQVGVEVTSAFQPIGNCGKAVIEGSELTLNVTGLASGDFAMTFSSDTIITLDNDCYDETEEIDGDLEMLYDILRDAEDPSKKFKLQEVPAFSSTAAVSAGPNGYGSGRTGTTLAATDVATTEMIFADPNPGGLPCNKFRISAPRTLPG